jgi:uncharacterized protein YjbJ (UPF0337 family)
VRIEHSHHFIEETTMGSTTDKIKGAANEAAGAVKETVGKAVGNPSLEIEGAGQKLKGETQGAVGDAKEAVKKIIDKV